MWVLWPTCGRRNGLSGSVLSFYCVMGLWCQAHGHHLYLLSHFTGPFGTYRLILLLDNYINVYNVSWLLFPPTLSFWLPTCVHSTPPIPASPFPVCIVIPFVYLCNHWIETLHWSLLGAICVTEDIGFPLSPDRSVTNILVVRVETPESLPPVPTDPSFPSLRRTTGWSCGHLLLAHLLLLCCVLWETALHDWIRGSSFLHPVESSLVWSVFSPSSQDAK